MPNSPPPLPTPQTNPAIHSSPNQAVSVTESVTTPSDSGSLILARAREVRMRKLTTSTCTQFYGGTSLFQMQLSGNSNTPASMTGQSPASTHNMVPSGIVESEYLQQFRFDPKDETCRKLIATFFLNCYPFHMYVYREWFLRDYDVGHGPYYSEPLLYSICAVGALVSPDPTHRALSAIFSNKASALVLQSLNLPDITILQALIMLGCLEISQGRSSKGWLYCGMAFRLTHEMGLHLDPNNWNRHTSESSVDREILRRVYWAVFIVDKQLSMYFGRPPALYPHEADVKDTIRIPYPDEWQRLLDLYVCKGTSPTAFEDGIPLVACFIHQVKLSKILHTMIVDVFENRRRNDAASEAASQVHVALVRWLSELPAKLHWNQWSVGQFPPHVLHLHMLFHTTMIILHRPPRQRLDDRAVQTSEAVEICCQSLGALLKLIRSYGRYYAFEYLPLDFVQTLACAAEVIMIKRYIDKAGWEERDVAAGMGLVLEVMGKLEGVAPSVGEIRESIVASMEAGRAEVGENRTAPGENGREGDTAQEYQAPQYPPLLDLDFGALCQPAAGPFPDIEWDHEGMGGRVEGADLGFLVTDDFLNEHFSW